MATKFEVCKLCVTKCKKEVLEAEKAELHTAYQSNPSNANREAIINKQKEIKAVMACTQNPGQSA